MKTKTILVTSQIVNNTGARINGQCLRAEINGDEKVVRAHCSDCDNSGVYCYGNIHELIKDMSSELFYGKWEFSDSPNPLAPNTILALCPSCIKERENK